MNKVEYGEGYCFICKTVKSFKSNQPPYATKSFRCIECNEPYYVDYNHYIKAGMEPLQ